jgi:outer membrane immunogenic protein
MRKPWLGRVALVASVALAVLGSPAAGQTPGAPASNWTGFYAGLNVGYGWGDESIRVSGDAAATQPAIAAGVLPRSFADDPSGIIGGAQIGYNHQIGWAVLGLETDFQGADIRAQQTVSTNVPGFFPFTTRGEQNLEFLGTARGRFGVALLDSMILYATGGLAYGHVELSTTSTNPGCVGICTRGSTSKTLSGWTAGGGVEYAFFPRWSVKGEYLYYDLGRVSESLTDITGRTPGIFQTYRVSVQGNVIRLGVNYKFW